MLDTREAICQLARIEQAADVRRQDVHQFIKLLRLAKSVALYHVPQVGLTEERVQVLHLLPWLVDREGERRGKRIRKCVCLCTIYEVRCAIY